MNWTHILLHHKGIFKTDDSHSFELVKKYHVEVLGWQDIGYHYFIERDGTVQAGRSLDIKGAHAGVDEWNEKAIGVCLDGNMEEQRATDIQLDSLEELLRGLENKYNISKKNIFAHCDIKPKICPGRHLIWWLNAYKEVGRLTLIVERLRASLALLLTNRRV